MAGSDAPIRAVPPARDAMFSPPLCDCPAERVNAFAAGVCGAAMTLVRSDQLCPIGVAQALLGTVANLVAMADGDPDQVAEFRRVTLVALTQVEGRLRGFQ